MGLPPGWKVGSKPSRYLPLDNLPRLLIPIEAKHLEIFMGTEIGFQKPGPIATIAKPETPCCSIRIAFLSPEQENLREWTCGCRLEIVS